MDITEKNFYFGFIIMLIVLQVYQWHSMSKVKKEVNSIWTQVAILALTVSMKIQEYDKKIEESGK